MFLKLVLKGFKLKKLVVEPKKWLNRLNRLRNWSTGCARPIEDRSRNAKNFLSLPVAFSSRSRSVEAQRSLAKNLMLTASQPIDS